MLKQSIFFWIHIKYIITKVKMLITITMNIIFTQMFERSGHQNNWHDGGRDSVVYRRVKNPANTGSGMPRSSCLQAVWSCWWELGLRNVRGSSLHFLSLTPSQQAKRNTFWDYGSSGEELSSSALGIQDAGPLVPTLGAQVSRMEAVWVFKQLIHAGEGANLFLL